MNSLFLRIIKDEKGQILPWMVFLMALFIGIGGLTIDLGHAFVCYRELQASTDAATMAGAQEMALSSATVTSVKNAVYNYSALISSPGPGLNATSNLPNVALTVNLQCSAALASKGIICSSSPTGDNIIQVTQTASIPTYFIKALAYFGIKAANSISLSTVSTASMRGATNSPYNIVILVDTTNSMGSTDTDAECSGLRNNTREGCALNGIQLLLEGLKPCGTPTNCGSTTFDTVSLFVFPNLTASTSSKTNQVADDTTCPTSAPGSLPPYSTPAATNSATYTAPTNGPTYQITGFDYNYLTNNASGNGATINTTNDPLANALGVGTCQGLQTPGGDGTYLAGAIYQAGAALAAAGAANVNSKNALIILSDGDSGSNSVNFPSSIKAGSGKYPSTIDLCQQGITAANWVTQNVPNTTVYTVAFGSPNTGCGTDSGLTPCQAMAQMSSGYVSSGTAPNFYSDANATQKGQSGHCTAPNTSNFTSLAQIFTALTANFTKAHLIPNSVWGT